MRRMFSEKQIEKMAQDVAEEVASDYELKADLEDDVIDIMEDYPLDEDITITTAQTNMTSYYAHARVSNGKLNIVLAFLANGDLTATDEKIGSINLPSTVLSKLYPYFERYLSTKTGYFNNYGTGNVAGRTTIQLRKTDSGIDIYMAQNQHSISANFDLRFEFNFLLS